ncbi:UDP-glucose dehydrogenase [Microbacterium phage Smarties]|uniref:UDP-glucose dehydrogenase n=1 Tax=Microbacterium phage Ariadne TaxID=2656546 RepID=A0A649VAX4_9CAUD|nr:UDP-glucose dehydrogenase [Microbacterium phage Ariadne]QGJ89497.1 UDP-glucose dehydrogenase [Microbacterium phage Ariadne]QGJ91484.1 UDP-glucose dehydrogenase [Microbacterium phage Smarties]
MRVLQVGYGVIGREVFRDYEPALDAAGHYLMVRDLVTTVADYEWDGQQVDLAVILVNTPADGRGGFDYSDLLTAVRQYLPVARRILIRSTVGLDFLETALYRAHAARIGFSPEFYGATKWSRRGLLDLDFTIFTTNVEQWFIDAVGGPNPIIADPGEVILAKLAENAYLATKVTFFHELQIAAADHGLDGGIVRAIVTADPRIGQAHSHLEEPGWQSHCFDKDVPVYAQTVDSTLVRAAILANRANLLPRRKSPVPPEN